MMPHLLPKSAFFGVAEAIFYPAPERHFYVPVTIAHIDAVSHGEDSNQPEYRVYPILIKNIMNHLQDVNKPAYDVEFPRYVMGGLSPPNL